MKFRIIAAGVLVVCTASISATGDAQDTALPFPFPPLRPINAPLAASAVGPLSRTDTRPTSMEIGARLAVSDLRLYDAQLGTQYPFSRDTYPADSIRAAKVARARIWLARLDTAAHADVDGRALVDRAEVAFRAEEDDVARRYIEQRLAQLPTTPAGNVAKSEVLGALITLLTNTEQDSARLARNLTVAEAYAAKLSALPASGYALRSDSTDILYRQYQAAQNLVSAADAARQPQHVIDAAFALTKIVAHFNFSERRMAVMYEYPFREAAVAFQQRPDGRARFDSLCMILSTFGSDHQGDVERPRPENSVPMATQWREQLRERLAVFKALGQPAPPLTAHAWLNTPDSAYHSTPSTRMLNDGVVHVLAFEGAQTMLMPALQRLARQFPSGVQVVLVTATTGHIGPTIAEPADEVTWLAEYYRTKRHFTVPVALWAGEKVAGEYGSKMSTPSPVAPAFHAEWLDRALVLVDGRGKIRDYLPVTTRADESRLARRVQALVTESHP